MIGLNDNHFPKIILAYYTLASITLFSAYISFPYAFVPMFVSILLLIPIYLWYDDYQEKEKLSKEVNGRDKRTTLQWIFTLFILALSIRVPSALLFGEPYEKTALIFLIISTIAVIEKTNISSFGFKIKNIEKALLFGLAFFAVFGGVLILSSSLLVLAFTNQMLISSYSIAIFLSAMPFQTLCVGISEEGLFRGYMQTHLRKFYTVGTAIFIQAAFFGAWHFVWNIYPFNLIGMSQYIATTFLIGLLFGYFYSKSKNLIPLIFAHGLYNSFLEGVIENGAVSNVLQTLPVANQILITALPYAFSAMAMFLFIKYLVKEI
jgi:membrane protease YdiL (CAAX protease family)